MPHFLPHRLIELRVCGPQLATDTLSKCPVVGVVGSSLTKSTCYLQRPSVEVPRLMQLDLGGEQVSDKVNCPLYAQPPLGLLSCGAHSIPRTAVGGERPE